MASAKTKEVKKPAAKKPVAKKPAAKKPAAKKPAAKKPVAKKPVAKKPVAKAGQLMDFSVEQKLKALFDLQNVDSEIDKIRIQRGELPLEVQDLEDDIAGLQTRIDNFNEETGALETDISNKENQIKEAKVAIKKYEKQQDNVRNNREYDSLTKEIEFQKLEMQLADKKIVELKATIENKTEVISESKGSLKERKGDLKFKKKELDDIVAGTEKEEKKLIKKSNGAEKIIEERLLTGYKRIRDNARNGLAVVAVERDACGGCFNKIPPQRQLDIRLHKKVIICEHCGRILVDPEIQSVDI